MRRIWLNTRAAAIAARRAIDRLMGGPWPSRPDGVRLRYAVVRRDEDSQRWYVDLPRWAEVAAAAAAANDERFAHRVARAVARNRIRAVIAAATDDPSAPVGVDDDDDDPGADTND